MKRDSLSEAQLTHLIYEVAEDRGLDTLGGWQQLLVELARYLGAQKGHIFLVDPGERVVETRHLGSDDKSIAEYHQYYQSIDPRFACALREQNRVYSDVDAVAPAAFERSEIYNDYLEPLGIRYSLFSVLEFEPGRLAPQAFFRPSSEGPFERDDVERFQRLLPHLARALRLRRLLLSTHGGNEELQQTLDALPYPTVTLTATGELVCLSQRARELLQRTPSLHVRRGRLRPSEPREASRYAEALAATVSLAEPRQGAKHEPLEVPPMVSISRPEQRPLGLLMLPLMPRHGLRAKTTRSARVLMVMHDPDALTRLDPRSLQALHGLTATEAQLAVALTEGKTLGDFARARGGSEQTARVHLKRILDKTQTRRQSDLVRVLLSSGVLQVRGLE